MIEEDLERRETWELLAKLGAPVCYFCDKIQLLSSYDESELVLSEELIHLIGGNTREILRAYKLRTERCTVECYSEEELPF